MPMEASKQDLAEYKKAKRLYESDRPPAKDGGYDPVPEPLHNEPRHHDPDGNNGRDLQPLQQPVSRNLFTSIAF